MDSSDPAWLATELDAPQGRASNFQEIDLNGDAGLSSVRFVSAYARHQCHINMMMQGWPVNCNVSPCTQQQKLDQVRTEDWFQT